MHLTDLLRTLRARWPSIAVITALFLTASWLLLPDKLAQRDNQLAVRASSTLVLDATTAGAAAGGNKAGANQLSTLKVIASEGEVPAQVADALSIPVPQLLARVTITSTLATSTLSIAALDRTRDGAVRTADTYSTTLLNLLTSQAQAARTASERALTQQITELEANKALLEASLKTDPSGKAGVDSLNRQLNAQRTKLGELTGAPPPTAPLRSIGPPTVQRLASAPTADRFLRLPVRLGLAGLFGVGLSLAGLALVDRFDVRLRTRREVELAYGLPVLAEVPAFPRQRQGTLLVASEPHGAYAESHRILRTSILRSNPAAAEGSPHERPGSCLIVVTSADPGEGKTSTAANLAASFAEAGSDTILVGLDLRHNDLQTHVPTGLRSVEIRLPTGRSSTSVLRLLVRATGIRDLRLVTLSPPPLDPPAIVLPVVAAWLKGLKDQVDVIVVDTPPLLVCNDTSEVIPFADTVLLACRVGVTTAEATERATEVLARLQAPVCGVVLVGAAVRAAARKVSAYGGAAWASTDDASDDPGSDDPGRGLGPVGGVPAPPWRVPVPRKAPSPVAEEVEPPKPGLVHGERMREAEVQAAAGTELPGVTGDERLRRARPVAGHDARLAPPAELATESPGPAPETDWRGMPLPEPGASTIGRRTLDLAGRITGRRRPRR